MNNPTTLRDTAPLPWKASQEEAYDYAKPKDIPWTIRDKRGSIVLHVYGKQIATAIVEAVNKIHGEKDG